MSFEEKFAAQGRKMDELKTKMNEALEAAKLVRQQNREQIAANIAKLDVAIDELDAEIDKKIDSQIDTLGMKIDQTANDISAAIDLTEEKMLQDVDKVKGAFTLDKKTAESIAKEPTKIDKIQADTADQVASAIGLGNAAEENLRLAQENTEAKRSALMLHAQMNVKNAKEKVAAHKEAVDRAAQEAIILDLLEYADACQEIAYAYALEAENALSEAASEIADYTEKFGK